MKACHILIQEDFNLSGKQERKERVSNLTAKKMIGRNKNSNGKSPERN